MTSSPDSGKTGFPPVPAVILAMLSVQGGSAVAKDMFPVLGPMGVVALRIVISAGILLAVFRPQLSMLERTQWQAAIPYGVVLGLMNFSFYLALSKIPLGLAVAVEFTGPLMVAVVGSRQARDVMWVILAATGIVLLTPWGGSRNVNGAGLLLALLAGLFWGAYILLGKRVSHLFPGGTGVATGMLFAALTILPFGLQEKKLAHLTPALFSQSFLVAILSSVVPYSLEIIGLRAMPPRTFGIFMSIEPAIAALCGMLFLKEHLTLLQWVAVALVVTASTGTTLTAESPEVPVDA